MQSNQRTWSRTGQVVGSLGKHVIHVAQQQTREEPRGQEKQGAPGNKKSRDRQDLDQKPGSHKNVRAKKGW